jgi:hypothetical protein|tara:strand:- start:92 stop:535 length:444 start_codon:yes stop_codon:yes gene_type:complete
MILTMTERELTSEELDDPIQMEKIEREAWGATLAHFDKTGEFGGISGLMDDMIRSALGEDWIPEFLPNEGMDRLDHLGNRMKILIAYLDRRKKSKFVMDNVDNQGDREIREQYEDGSEGIVGWLKIDPQLGLDKGDELANWILNRLN